MVILTIVLGIVGGLAALIASYGVYRQIKSTNEAEQKQLKDENNDKIEDARKEERERCSDLMAQKDQIIRSGELALASMEENRNYYRGRYDAVQDQLNRMLGLKGGETT